LRRREKSGIVERAVEDWLTRVDERNYQLPFAQVLMSEGYTVLKISRHEHLEQGKDIVAKDKGGCFHAYQMKRGNINLPEWRAIKPEIDELIQLPISGPSVPKTSPYTSYLVTNGRIGEDVVRQVDDMNQDNKLKKRKWSFLKLIQLDELTKRFIDAERILWPSKLADTRQFLNLLASDGKEFFPKEQFSDFLSRWMSRAESPSTARNLIFASTIVAAQILRPYEAVENWFAIFEGWTCLSAAIVWLAAKHSLKPSEWKQSFELTRRASTDALRSLKKECLSRQDMIEGSLIGDGGLIYKVRAVLVIGSLSALELSDVRSGCTEGFNPELKKWIAGNLEHLWYWGESAFPCYLNIIRYLEAVGENGRAKDILGLVLNRTATCNAADSPGGIPDPYVSVSGILSFTFGFQDPPLDLDQFVTLSYGLESLVYMAVRRGYRDLINGNWYTISKVQYAELVPDEPSDYFSWYVAKGLNRARFPEPTQSYHELETKSLSSGSCAVPFLDITREFIPFWLMVCPQRASPPLVNTVDEILPIGAGALPAEDAGN